MTDATNEQDRRDVLVARVVDGNATSEDWRELRALAANDQAVWAELAEQQDLKRELDAAMDDAVSIAETVALPMHAHVSVAPQRRFSLALTAGGWLAAACLLVAWTTGMTPQYTNAPIIDSSPANPGGIDNVINSASEALARYLELGKQSGEVIGELPTSLVLERTPNAEGGYDVIYLRQIVEKTTVDSIHTTEVDDAGQTFIVPKDTTTTAQPQSGEAPLPAAW